MNKKELAKKTMKLLIPGVILAYGLTGVPEIMSERISDKHRLNQVIEEENINLGLKNVKIQGYFFDKHNISSLIKPAESYKSHGLYKDDNGNIVNPDYQINIFNTLGMTRGIVRHELAHIANGDLEGRKVGFSNPAYWTYQEHIANLYGATKINLGSNKLLK